MASMVRMRETMRLEFYQFLLLKKQIQMNEQQRIMCKEGTGWELKGLWKRLFGRRRRVENKGPGSVSQGQSKLPKLESVF